MIEDLRELFEEYGTIVDIIAKKNIKAKGQAFIVYDSVESAQEALDELQGFELHGREIELAFAKTRSDATVKREDGDEGLETHKRHRLAEKGALNRAHQLCTLPADTIAERKQALEAAQKPAKRPATDALAERPAKTAKPAAMSAGDEYLPPNKILYLRELPEDYGKDNLAAIFGRFPGFKEVRTVPGRKTIAFVEYEAEEGAIAAKERTAGMTLGEKAISVTFQKK